MENPLTTIRHELRLSRKDLCQAAGLRRDGLYLLEAGLLNRPQRRMLDFLEDLGFDRQRVLEAYQDYRADLRSRVLSGIEQAAVEAPREPNDSSPRHITRY